MKALFDVIIAFVAFAVVLECGFIVAEKISDIPVIKRRAKKYPDDEEEW